MKYEYDQVINDLAKIVWRFTMMDSVVFLEQMLCMERPSTRHKFKVDMNNSYSRLHDRDFGIKTEPDVPIEIAADAVRDYRSEIKFRKWDRNARYM